MNKPLTLVYKGIFLFVFFLSYFYVLFHFPFIFVVLKGFSLIMLRSNDSGEKSRVYWTIGFFCYCWKKKKLFFSLFYQTENQFLHVWSDLKYATLHLPSFLYRNTFSARNFFCHFLSIPLFTLFHFCFSLVAINYRCRSNYIIEKRFDLSK